MARTKTTQQICRAFYNGEALTMGNTYTDGKAIYLFGNKIAFKERGAVWITDCGWCSRTTQERLSGLYGVNSLTRRKGEWTLNGRPWDGAPVRI